MYIYIYNIYIYIYNIYIYILIINNNKNNNYKSNT